MQERLKRVGHRLAQLHQPGDDVLAEVVAGVGVGRVAPQLVGEELGVKDIDAHAGQRPFRIVRHGRRVEGLFHEVQDTILGVHVHDPEAGGLPAGHLDTGDGHVGPLLDVLLQHRLVVHLVDVIARQHDHEAGLVLLHDVQVLEHRVGGAEVPLLLGDPLAGRQYVEGLVALGAEEVPAALQMPDQAVGLVLRGHGDASDARVQGVGQGEVDDAEFAPEEHRRLGADVGQLQQPAAAAAGQHIGHRLARERAAGIARVRHVGLSTRGRLTLTRSGICLATEIEGGQGGQHDFGGRIQTMRRDGACDDLAEVAHA